MTVLDIDLTANRSDCTNIIGLAREAAILGTEFRMPDTCTGTAGGTLKWRKMCRRQICAVMYSDIENIKIGHRRRDAEHLRACGMPISTLST